MNKITEFIRNRRSVVIRNLTNQPVPQADLDLIIDCGMRVPDHAVLAPWRLVVILPDQACHLGTTFLSILATAVIQGGGDLTHFLVHVGYIFARFGPNRPQICIRDVEI